MASYMVNKAKKAMRKFNDSIYNEKSEVYQATVMVNATQADHIFTQSDYPTIADYVENLIILTPNQHYSMANPNNKTKYVYKDFQYICLIAKSTKIYLDLTSEKEDKFYDFEDYKFVLNTGFETEDFSSISYLDFASIIDKIGYYYIDNISSNKYQKLINDNKLDRNSFYLSSLNDAKMIAEDISGYET
ncbi:TPA: hypothetical protein ACJVMN_000574 [Streptococcus agalactiae]